jgi:phospholipid/cholesterol/gamma-HCH transport system substrate-binding protein
MRIDPRYGQIPDDSFASIQTQGLLGGKYIGISPGGSDQYLKDGSTIDQTQSAIVLENVINKFFANYSSGGGQSQNSGGQNSPQPNTTNKPESNK